MEDQDNSSDRRFQFVFQLFLPVSDISIVLYFEEPGFIRIEFEDLLALFDLELERSCLLLLVRPVEDSPALQRKLFKHLSLNVLVKLLFTDMSLETPALAHQNFTSVYACAFNFELVFAHLNLPLVTELFDLLLVLDLVH